jgi:hypothetical protein
MRRRLTVMAVAVLVAGLALFVGVAAAQEETTPQEEGTTAQSTQSGVTPQARARTVTKTFPNTAMITIPETPSAAQSSQISVGGRFGRGRIRDVNLHLSGFTHAFPEDVDVMLAKGQTNRTVISDIDAGSASNVNFVLDDQAVNALPSANAILVGGFSYRPENREGNNNDAFGALAPAPSGISALNGFNGQRAGGTWTLYVVDDFMGSTGNIQNGWSLTITARIPRR